MTTAGDGKAPCGSGGAGEKFHKRPIQTDEGGNSAATGRKSELEEMLKQVTVTISSLSVSRISHSYLHPTTMEDLPDELLINIFMRLLAKQLAQMRSVSKSWNSLLCHPSFVKSHLHLSIRNNNEQILLVFSDYYKPFTQYYSCESHRLEPTNFIKQTPVHAPNRVIGSVNGLICISEYSYSNIQIWNPSLSAVSAIPPPCSMPIWPKYQTSIRFGFDPKTDDYKLVTILGVSDSEYNVKEWLQVEVYNMRKGSWEFISQPFPSHITRIYDCDELCVDGHDGYLHWQIKPVATTEETIVAFDLGSETFSEIPLPLSILDSHHRLHRLGVLGGKLCVRTWCDDGAWEVWVMEEYGVPESWVKRHVFSQFIGYWSYPCGFTSRNELVFMDKDYQLALYDPIANKTKFTRIEQLPFKIVEYVDSLVWV